MSNRSEGAAEYLNDLYEKKEGKIIFESDSGSKLGSYGLEVDSIYTYLLYIYWKKADLERKMEGPEFAENPGNYTKLITKKFGNARRNMVYVFLCILVTLFFQVVALNALELNLYIITSTTQNQSLGTNLSRMDVLYDQNEAKEDFVVKISGYTYGGEKSETSPSGYEDVSIVVPGAYRFSNFFSIVSTLSFNAMFNNYASKALNFYPFMNQFKVLSFPITNYTTESTSVVYYQNLSDEWTYQSLPIVVKDNYDLMALTGLDLVAYNSFINAANTMSIKTTLYPDYNEDASTAAGILTKPDADVIPWEYYWNFDSVLGELSGEVMCFYGTLPASPLQTVEGVFQDNSSIGSATFIPNYTVCNFYCGTDPSYDSATWKGFAFDFDFTSSVPTCTCVNNADYTNMSQNSFKWDTNSCIQNDYLIIDVIKFFMKFSSGVYGIRTNAVQYFDNNPNYDETTYLGIKADTLDTSSTFMQQFKGNTKVTESLSGVFIKPVVIKDYTSCYDGNQVDLKGDLLVYPIFTESYNQNVNTISLGCFTMTSDQMDALGNMPVTVLNSALSPDNSINVTITSTCSKICMAYDGFGLNLTNDGKKNYNCVCLANQNININFGSDPSDYIDVDLTSIDTTWAKCTGPPDDTSLSVYFYMNVDFNGIDTINYQSDDMDPNDVNPNGGMVVSGIRNKLLVIPSVDNDLMCNYSGNVNYSVIDGDNNRIIKSASINSSNPLQYTRVNGKTLFICTPDTNSFGTNLTIYPNFDIMPALGKTAEKDMRYYFGDTLRNYYLGCPLSATDGDVSYSFLTKAQEAAWLSSNYKLPRILSYSKYNNRIVYNYYSGYSYGYGQQTIIQALSTKTLDSHFNFTSLYFATTVMFCGLLVLLNIFDESNEALFCLYVSSRLYYIYMHIYTDNWTKMRFTFIWFMQITFSIVRIAVLTYKVIVIVLLSNNSVTVDALMMNSLALIFVLELDSVMYSWLFNKSKTYEFECSNFGKSFMEIRIYFNLKYYICILVSIYLFYITGIYSYKNQSYTVIELLDFAFDGTMTSDKWEILIYMVCFIFSFGVLVVETTVKLFSIIKFQKLENNNKIIAMMFTLTLISVYGCLFMFIMVDYSFYYSDYVQCLNSGNLNCNNNLELNQTVNENNLWMLVLTPIYFIFSFLLNAVIAGIIWLATKAGLYKDDYSDDKGGDEYEIGEFKDNTYNIDTGREIGQEGENREHVDLDKMNTIKKYESKKKKTEYLYFKPELIEEQEFADFEYPNMGSVETQLQVLTYKSHKFEHMQLNSMADSYPDYIGAKKGNINNKYKYDVDFKSEILALEMFVENRGNDVLREMDEQLFIKLNKASKYSMNIYKVLKLNVEDAMQRYILLSKKGE